MSKYLPHGTTVSIGGQTIGGLISVSIPEGSRGEAETTDTDSGGDRTYIAGLRENGTVELSMRHDPDDAGQQALETNYTSSGGDEVEEVIITLPDAATATSGDQQTYTFDAYVISRPSGDLALTDDAAAELSCSLKVASAVTISTP